jgi:hypothetical protein
MWAGVASALLLGGCLNSTDNKAIDAAETQFFTQVAAKQYEAIYDAASPDFQASGTKDAFVALMQHMDEKLGACQPAVRQMDYHININQAGTFVTQGYQTKCANGTLDQKLQIVLRGGVAKLLRYDADSPALVN